MKPTTVLVLLAMVAVPAMLAFSSLAPQEEDGPVRHIVAMKFTEDATEEQIQEISDAFRDLTTTIEGITDFEYGKNNSPEGKDQGFQYVYVLTFENAAARDAYLPHPEHRKFGGLLRTSGIYEEVFVVDFVPQN